MSASDLPTRSVVVHQHLTDAGVSPAIRQLPESTRTAVEAATALGCDVGAIASSLVFLADGEPLLVMTSGRHRVDTQLLAGHLGVTRIDRADAKQVRALTGQAIGGVAPVGHPERLRTVVDVALSEHDPVWAAAGTPNTVMPLGFQQLVQLTQGMVCPVAAD